MVAVAMPVLRRRSAFITGVAIFVAMSSRRTLPCVLALAFAVPAAAATAKAPAPWATVNICDTADNPDTIGIRGSMPPGGNAGDEMFMRFQVQFQRDDGSWRLMGAAGDSGFIDVGRARAKPRQAGHSFWLSPPAAGNVFTLRGVVTFEWRARDGTVDRRARKRTTGGHLSTAGADPSGFTAAECTVSA
jgi:hypothetical protein